MDMIFIKGIQVHAIIGVYDYERTKPRPLELDVELYTDITEAAKTDNIACALDYATVTERLKSFIATTEYLLLETLIEHCATMLLQEFLASRVKLIMHKPGALDPDIDVGISIERTRNA